MICFIKSLPHLDAGYLALSKLYSAAPTNYILHIRREGHDVKKFDSVTEATTFYEQERPGKEHNLLVILNPMSGTGRSFSLYTSVVEPFFKLCNVRHTLLKTSHVNHAYEYLSTSDLSYFTAIVSISGDGIIHEIINAIMHRSDWDKQRKTPLGIIPSGSSNALAWNLKLGDVKDALFAILQGKTLEMDLFCVISKGSRIYSHMSIMWTFLADIDLGSDAFRALGTSRYTVVALLRVMRLRHYTGDLFFLESKGTGNPITTGDDGFVNLQYIVGDAYQKWNHVQGTFDYFVASNLPLVDQNFLVSPEPSPQSASLQLIYSQRMTKLQVLKTLLDSSSGNYLKEKGVVQKSISAFVLFPHGYVYSGFCDSCSGKERNGFLDVSGEEIDYSEIRVEILPRLLSVIVP